MKLLIVDDEKLTREGIRDSLDLNRLGITQVLLADDGVHGLKTVIEEQPDIVLTDVRMPRMDGVRMAEQLLRERPGTAVIFMSAYSDKEYLKAAIKLKAVSYVEKPLDMEELAAAVKEAVGKCRMEGASQAVAKLHEQEQKGHLTLLLTDPSPESIENARAIAGQMELSITSSTCFSALIIDSVLPVSTLSEDKLNQVKGSFENIASSLGLAHCYFVRADHRIIIFLYSDQRAEDKIFLSCAEGIAGYLKGICRFFISLGPVVSGIERAHISYMKAKEHINESFFHDYGTILTQDMENPAFHPPGDLILEFSMALSEKQEKKACEIAAQLYESFVPSDMMGPSQVRDIYYRYFSKLDEHALNNYILLWQREGLQSESIWEGVMGCLTLRELHDLLTAKIRLYFCRLEENSVGNPVVFQIKEYIHHNYGVSSLSVPDVSEYVHLSSSYVCTIFKSETGQTLNQYLTDYRIKMSKQFLCDSRYKIADISSKVGYSDGNYYSKAFRKIVGLSPSEYREKMLS